MARKTARMVLIAGRGGLGGAQRMVEYLQGEMEQRGWTVEWVTPADLGPVRQSRRFPGLNEAFRTLAMARALRRMPAVDLSISHGTYGMGSKGRRIHTFHGLFAALLDACRSGTPRLDYLVGRWVIGTLEQMSGLPAARVAVSRRVERELGQYYRLSCRAVLHNGVDPNHFRTAGEKPELRRRFGLPETEYLYLVVGRMDYGKGREVLRELQSLAPGRLVLAAPTASRIEELVDRGAIRLEGVPYADLPALYGACDVLLCPSLYEGFGLTLVEAWASGMPVVTGRVGVVEELEGQSAAFDRCVTAPGDAAGLAAALHCLRDCPAVAREQAEWGREQVAERFSLAKFGERWMSCIETVMDGAR